jgi:hypothetical protein
MDSILAQSHHVTDFFFSLAPLTPETRLERIFALSLENVVEVETHPINQAENRFLTGGGFARFAEQARVVPSSVFHPRCSSV